MELNVFSGIFEGSFSSIPLFGTARRAEYRNKLCLVGDLLQLCSQYNYKKQAIADDLGVKLLANLVNWNRKTLRKCLGKTGRNIWLGIGENPEEIGVLCRISYIFMAIMMAQTGKMSANPPRRHKNVSFVSPETSEDSPRRISADPLKFGKSEQSEATEPNSDSEAELLFTMDDEEGGGISFVSNISASRGISGNKSGTELSQIQETEEINSDESRESPTDNGEIPQNLETDYTNLQPELGISASLPINITQTRKSARRRQSLDSGDPNEVDVEVELKVLPELSTLLSAGVLPKTREFRDLSRSFAGTGLSRMSFSQRLKLEELLEELQSE